LKINNYPLEGVRILDLSMWWAGPYATCLLAYLGAEVIKIESWNHLDPWRGDVHVPPGIDRYPDNIPGERPYNRNAYFNRINHNKKGITLDLRHPYGKDIFKRLVKISDVVVENYSNKAREKLGINYDILKGYNPLIILASLPMFGITGPEKEFRGYGNTIEALSGIYHATGYLEGKPQMLGHTAFGDPVAAFTAALAIMVALYYKEYNNRGCHIEIAQIETIIPFNGIPFMDYSMNKRVQNRCGNKHSSMAPHDCFPCKGEDEWVSIFISTDEEWISLCKEMGKPELISDPRFLTSLHRWINQEELNEVISDWTKHFNKYELMKKFQGLGIACGPLLKIPELLDQHLKERNFFEMVSHPDAGIHLYESSPIRLGSFKGKFIRTPSPCFGEHNDYVYKDLLGLSPKEIEELKKEKVISNIPASIGLF
jgi:crotonobetainyl-CoA:carnitine CoA-transferase CaiB-like acyl-CoA transferase